VSTKRTFIPENETSDEILAVIVADDPVGKLIVPERLLLVVAATGLPPSPPPPPPPPQPARVSETAKRTANKRASERFIDSSGE
jgi:hypothetical protein